MMNWINIKPGIREMYSCWLIEHNSQLRCYTNKTIYDKSSL